MDLKIISIILVIFFLAIASASAANDNMSDSDDVLSIAVDDNVSLSSCDSEVVSVAEDNCSLATCDDEPLSASQEENNLSISYVESIPLSVSVTSDSTLSASNEPTLSISNSMEDSKLTSIYDKVYSTKKWKSIKLTSFKVKKSWSKSKRDKVINKKWKAADKKVNKYINKYTKKGWCYERCLWTWQVGSKKVSYQYYVQFSKTVYYDGYGNVY